MGLKLVSDKLPMTFYVHFLMFSLACVKVLLLIIDHTIDLTLLNQVKHLNSLSTNQVRVFVYSVGLANQDSVARQVACDNFGAWYKMDSQSDLVVAREYYTMLAEPNFASQVTWTKQDPVGYVEILAHVSPPYH